MGRKRKAVDGGKVANKGKTTKSEKTKGKEKEQSETAQTVLESKDAENMHSPGNDLSPEHVSRIEHIVEGENLVEKVKEELSHCQKVGTVPILDEGNMEHKQVCRTTNADPSSELSYKSMYISSQKQIESLMAENCQLSMKLEFARGKIEAYEKVNDATRTTKNVIPLDSILGKSKENAIGNGNSAPDADNHDSKNASNIVNALKKVPWQRKKNC